VTDQQKEIMKVNAGKEYNKILVNHWRWLEAQGPSYKDQAASCKRQASSLTRRLYGVIGESRRKKL
jgi:hypothetical protein